ncbi:DUF805 domain-containing protein [Jannaschia sp. R86511]|uniref:DUF805 domain-containing protein n=1 Tax=Jannaschia sp. R86511 TaxID=3093853 RepID=UPI0036D35D2A
MTFQEAIGRCLRRYAELHGRARRSEYWWFTLFFVLVVTAGGLLDQAFGFTEAPEGGGPVAGLLTLALLLPLLGVGARRLHDTGRSAWWLTLGLVPVGGVVVLLLWAAQPSQPDANEHGPAPVDGAPVGRAPDLTRP